VFFGKLTPRFELGTVFGDAKPREIVVTACLLVPIIGIGFYPKLVTRTYDVKTVEVATKAREAVYVLAQRNNSSQPQQLAAFYTPAFVAPNLAAPVID
jgi:NAD(P)H-quinone oxidoreductase subunit 4